MRGTRLRADLVVGRKLRDRDGQVLGKIRELRIELEAPGARDYVVRELELSPPSLLESLVGPQFATIAARWLGRKPRRFTLAWDRVDFSDPRKPRLRE